MFQRKTSRIDEIAANLTDEDYAAMAGVPGMPTKKRHLDTPEDRMAKQMQEIEDMKKAKNEKSRRDLCVKGTENIDWSEEKKPAVPFVDDPNNIPNANLEKGVFTYSWKNKYPNMKMKFQGVEHPLGWTEEELEKAREIEQSDDPKFKSFVKW